MVELCKHISSDLSDVPTLNCSRLWEAFLTFLVIMWVKLLMHPDLQKQYHWLLRPIILHIEILFFMFSIPCAPIRRKPEYSPYIWCWQPATCILKTASVPRTRGASTQLFRLASQISRDNINRNAYCHPCLILNVADKKAWGCCWSSYSSMPSALVHLPWALSTCSCFQPGRLMNKGSFIGMCWHHQLDAF